MTAASTSKRATSSVLELATLVVILASAGCGRDFDDLFVDGGGGTASGANSAGGTSGSSVPADAADACACSPCTGPSCHFTCPKGCKSCTCDLFTCASDKCSIECSPGASCQIACGGANPCEVSCAEGAACFCKGAGCDVSCHDGDKKTCANGVACDRDCPR